MKNLLYTIAFLISTLGISAQCSQCHIIEFDERNQTWVPYDIFEAHDRVCLKPNSDIYTTTVEIEQSIDIPAGKQLHIQAGLRLRLENGASVNLTGEGASLMGDNHGNSIIEKVGSGSAVNLSDCQGCEISNLQIRGTNEELDGIGEGPGIVIDGSNSTNEEGDHVELSSLTVSNFLGDGVVINANGVTCKNLNLFRVASDGDCIGETGFAGIHLEGASNCELTNIVHTRSGGAVTLRLSGNANNNQGINITVEQEGGACRDKDDNTLNGDPSLHVHNDNCVSGNYIIMNLNSGYVYEVDDSGCDAGFCTSNTVIAGVERIFQECSGSSSNTICPE